MGGTEMMSTGADRPRKHHIRVERTARYYTLGEPDPEVREVWFACHGYRQLAGRFARRFAPLDDGARLIVVPEALSRFYLDDGTGPHGPEARIGATWMTREDRENEIRDYVGYLDALYERSFDALDRDAVRVHVLGFSQGTATVSRWAALGRARIDRLILWAGLPAHDLDLESAAEKLAAMDLTFAIGTDDPFSTPRRIEREIARLDGLGIPARMVTYDGGHRLNEEALVEVAGV